MARVLLVEDDPGQLEVREMLFQAAGHEVRTAATPEQARMIARDWQPGFVVTDLRLPAVEDGLSLIEELGSTVKVIVLTGARLDRPPTGAHRMLRKPCSSKVLLKAIAP